MKPKIYLAGPDVFYPNAQEVGQQLKEICEKHGVEGLFPLDGQVDLSQCKSGPEKGLKIYGADVGLIDEADGLVANLNPFRGVSADVGTCFEMGYAVAQGKPVWSYTADRRSYKQRAENLGYGDDGWVLEDFDLVDNLMMIGPTNNVVHASFEDAIKNISKFYKTIKNKLKNGGPICFDCAVQYGAKSDEGVHTFSPQKCSVCEQEKSCNAITDWIWPKSYGIGYVWD